jgi:thiosulfate dehydrogenase [quinone] large subunit
MTKYRAGFGRADILLVVDSAKQNPRVPVPFRFLTEHSLASAPGAFGVIVPAWETALGVALILGILTLPAACASLGTLMTYWLADQLIGQYPVMALLSATVLVFPVAAGALGVSGVLRSRVGAPHSPSAMLLHRHPRWL